MLISYSIKNKKIFDRLDIDIEPGSLTLITGYEGIETYLLSGILAGLFPIEIDEFVEPLNEILKYYNGIVKIHSCWKPDKAIYVGRDPEKHLLFSRVYEEIQMRGSGIEAVLGIMQKLDMGRGFLNRRISTLSGGEMMKVAISLALVKKADLYVFHGIFGWLDDTARDRMIEIIKGKMERGAGIIIIDEEYSPILPLARKTYYFDGKNVFSDGNSKLQIYKDEVTGIINGINKYKKTLKKARTRILEFKDVSFSYPHEKKESQFFSLKNISFNIESNRIYALVGRNGSGKSTIAGLISRVLKPESGEILFKGKAIQNYTREELLKKICYIGQFPEHQLVYSNIDEYKKAAVKSNNIFSFEFLKKYFPTDIPISLLSPYHMKLLLLLSNIWSTTELIILDEPTWGIGISEKVMLYTVLKEITAELKDLSILIITHSNELLDNLDCKVLEIIDGAIIR